MPLVEVRENEPLEKALRRLKKKVEREGILKAPERSMIYQIFELREKQVGGVVTPLSEVISLEESATIADLMERSRESGLSRLPVRETSGRFVGFVNLFDVAYEENMTKPIRSFLRALLSVPETMAVDEVLMALRSQKSPMALVTDGDGKARGIVTLEELLSELVGVG